MSFILDALFGKKEVGYSSYYHHVVGNASTGQFSDRLLVAAFEDTADFCQRCNAGAVKDVAYCQQMTTALGTAAPRYIAAKAVIQAADAAQAAVEAHNARLHES